MYIHQAESKFNRGMTIVEVLVAFVIISMALGPVMSGAISSLKIAENIRDNLTAVHLAQEGVEVIRALRDDNWLQGLAFNNGLLDGVYQAEMDSISLEPYDDNYPMVKNSSGLYNHSIGIATKFKRQITITNVSTNQIRITSAVSWPERGATKSVSVESNLFNWK